MIHSVINNSPAAEVSSRDCNKTVEIWFSVQDAPSSSYTHGQSIRKHNNLYMILLVILVKSGVYRILHRCKILYNPDYTKKTNLFLMKLSFPSCKKQKKSKKKQKTKKTAHWEKCYFVFDFTYILHILLFIIIKFDVNVSFHIILLLW